MRIPSPALVVLVGPSGAGKSTWAAATFAAGEGFAEVRGVVPVPWSAAPAPPDAAAAGGRGRLRFGLSISRFDWPGGGATLRDRLRQVAAEAEEAGFESIWRSPASPRSPPCSAVDGTAGTPDISLIYSASCGTYTSPRRTPPRHCPTRRTTGSAR